jgi:hypothetical protein
MDDIINEKQRILKHTIEPTENFIQELNPTKLIDIEFYKSYGLWDEEVSKKYDEVVKKWEKIKEITDQEKKPLTRIRIND